MQSLAEVRLVVLLVAELGTLLPAVQRIQRQLQVSPSLLDQFSSFLTWLGTGVTLSTSKGNCGIVSGVLTCASGVTSTVFTVSITPCKL